MHPTMHCIESRTIGDAWRDVMWECFKHGYEYIITKGSYEGQVRKQLDHVAIKITEPWSRPLAPIMPEGVGIPPTTSEEKIEQYFFEYLATDTKTDKEDYTYGQAIEPQTPQLLKILNESKGGSNQACISISNWESIKLKDPPCLRLIDFKVVDGRLDMSVFFRSWDLYTGLPENLGGLQLFKEYILNQLTFPITDGFIFAYSSGLHIYEQYDSVVKMLNISV